MVQADKRRAVRYPTDFSITCRWPNGEKQVRAINLSYGGVLVASDEPLAAGTLLRITFNVASGKEVTLNAMVRHSSQDRGCGIEFMQVMPREQERLAEYLEYLDAVCRAAAGFGPSLD